MCTLANKLKFLREQKHLTKKEVAEAVGVHPSSIGNLEKGSIPQADLLLNLAIFFNVSMEYLMNSHTEIEFTQYQQNSEESTSLNNFIELSSEEKEWQDLFHLLSPSDRRECIGYIKGFISASQRKTIANPQKTATKSVGKSSHTRDDNTSSEIA